MRFLKDFTRLILGVVLLLGLDFQMAEGLAQWHLFYRTGLQAMEQGDWNRAIESFQQAIKVKNRDSNKIRATGVMFIEYFPHRETGICYFHLGDRERAKQELTLSLAQAPSERARNFLARLNRGERASDPPSVAPPGPKGSGFVALILPGTITACALTMRDAPTTRTLRFTVRNA